MKAAIVVRGETIMLQGFLPEEHCKLSKELSSSAGSWIRKILSRLTKVDESFPPNATILFGGRKTEEFVRGELLFFIKKRKFTRSSKKFVLNS